MNRAHIESHTPQGPVSIHDFAPSLFPPLPLFERNALRNVCLVLVVEVDHIGSLLEEVEDPPHVHAAVGLQVQLPAQWENRQADIEIEFVVNVRPDLISILRWNPPPGEVRVIKPSLGLYPLEGFPFGRFDLHALFELLRLISQSPHQNKEKGTQDFAHVRSRLFLDLPNDLPGVPVGFDEVRVIDLRRHGVRLHRG